MDVLLARVELLAAVHELATLLTLQRERDHHPHLALLERVPFALWDERRIEIRWEVAVEHLALAHAAARGGRALVAAAAAAAGCSDGRNCGD